MAGVPNASPGAIKRILHGPVLDAAHWAVSVNTVHPSLHRLLNASFLTAGLFGGRTVMNLLTGETPSGAKIRREDVPAPLRPLHGVLAYNHFSDDPGDRWMKVMDMWFPAALGAVGAVSGSHVFALEQKLVQNANAILKTPQKLTLDAAESASVVLQAKPWRVLSGATSLFGSASGFQLVPGPSNYGSTLSMSFLGTVARNKYHTPYLPWLQEFLSGNASKYAYGPSSMLTKLKEYLVHNSEKNPKQARDMAYAILEPWFGEHATPKHIEAFLGEVTRVRAKFLQEGGVPEKLKAACEAELGAIMHGLGLEKTLQKIGLNPAEATIGHNGFMERVSRALGSEKTLNRLNENYKNAYLTRNGASPSSFVPAPHAPHVGASIFGGALTAAGVTAVGAGVLHSREWHQRDNEAMHAAQAATARKDTGLDARNPEDVSYRERQEKETERLNFSDRVVREKQRKTGGVKSSAIAETINDKPLALLEWGADVLNSPETYGMHRAYCAAGLSLGGFIGMKLMEVLTGKTLTGAAVGEEKIPSALKGLYKKFAYNAHSDHPHDRWGYVLHFAVPAVLATGGVIGASSYFFKDKVNKAQSAEYIDEYESKATMDEAKPWTLMTALTSLFATPAGFVFLPIPFVNYGAALGTRFNLSSERKAIMPVVGEMWTNTQSRYPLGPSKLRDLMVHYATNSKDDHPAQLEEMALGILKAWFTDVTPEQIEAFVRKVEEDRNQFIKSGGVPEELKAACEKQLMKDFKGAGLERTLREIGLDPAQAILGNNGLSGRIAEWLGGSEALAKTRSEFKTKYAERVREEKAAAATPACSKSELRRLLEYGAILDRIEAAVAPEHPDIVTQSVALQQDAGNTYANAAGSGPISRERMEHVLSRLLNAYRHTPEPKELREMEALLDAFRAARHAEPAEPKPAQHAARLHAVQKNQSPGLTL